MNFTQEATIKILNAAIRNEKVILDDEKYIPWEEIIEEGEAHSIKSLLYSAVSGSTILKNIDSEVLAKWKKDTFYSAITQVRHINEMANIMSEFNNNGIPAIVLKGLVVRAYYPRPDLRTMSDSDILVKESDLIKIKEVLLGQGYKEGEMSPVHIRYEKLGCLPIEIHFTLADDHYFKGIDEFEKDVWQNAIKLKVKDSEVLSMSLEDLALYLCIHMAKHIKDRGFGIRQLCDLVLLIEKKGQDIDWKKFLIKSKSCGIEKFNLSIFNICNKLFNMSIPKELSNAYSLDSKYIDILIQDIFEGGVYGKRDMVNTFANELAHNPYDDRSNNFIGVVKRIALFLFPPINQLSDKYSYAKKYSELAPIAWIHHLISGILREEYSIKSKLKFITTTASISSKKNSLIQWLEL